MTNLLKIPSNSNFSSDFTFCLDETGVIRQHHYFMVNTFSGDI
jgi:hypothetical protein